MQDSRAAGISAGNAAFSRDTSTFRYPGAPAGFVEEFRHYDGPTMNAFDAADKNGKALELRDALVDLFMRQNQSGRSDFTVIPATSLRVTVSRRVVNSRAPVRRAGARIDPRQCPCVW